MIPFILLALGAGPALPACTFPASRVTVADFTDHPRGLLELYPAGGRGMEARVTSLAGTSRVALAGLKTVFRIANTAQGEALGRGLARASQTCRTKNVEWARAIETLALRSGNDAIADAYRRTAGPEDDPTVLYAAGADAPAAAVPGVSLDRTSLTLPDPFAPVRIRGR
jgi:hypothetical protein